MPDEVPSNSQQRPAEPRPSEDRALSALKRLAKPQPKAFDAPVQAVPEMPLGPGSATGFVGTLAKGQSEDSRAGEAAEKGNDAPPPPQRASELIQMAREVSAHRPASPMAASPHAEPADRAPTVSRYRGLAPLMLLLALALLGIGGWAVGALWYMRNHPLLMSPRDVTYPLISWHIDLATGGAYSNASVMMAWSMVLCVPVGILLLVTGLMLRRKRPAP